MPLHTFCISIYATDREASQSDMDKVVETINENCYEILASGWYDEDTPNQRYAVLYQDAYSGNEHEMFSFLFDKYAVNLRWDEEYNTELSNSEWYGPHAASNKALELCKAYKLSKDAYYTFMSKQDGLRPYMLEDRIRHRSGHPYVD
jgi:hypothetical protein